MMRLCEGASAAWKVVDFACGIPHLLKGEFSRQLSVHPIDRFYAAHVSHWVRGGITLLIFPAMVPLLDVSKIGDRACGNCFILETI